MSCCREEHGEINIAAVSRAGGFTEVTMVRGAGGSFYTKSAEWGYESLHRRGLDHSGAKQKDTLWRDPPGWAALLGPDST